MVSIYLFVFLPVLISMVCCYVQSVTDECMNAIITVTNSVLFLLHTLSLLLICLLCICKYVSIFILVLVSFFSSRSRGFLRKADNRFYLQITSLPPSGCALIPFYPTSIHSFIPLVSDVYSFLTSRHQSSH